MTDHCAGCAARDQQIAKLLKILRIARKVIKRQKRQVDQVRQWAWNEKSGCERKMAKGGLARAAYAYLKGRKEVAHTVFNMLIIDWATTFLEMVGRVQGL